MRTFWNTVLGATLFVALFGLPAAADASAVSLLLGPGSGVQLLEDDDFEVVIGGDDDLLETGDYVYGMLVVTAVYNGQSKSSGVVPGFMANKETFTGLFFAQVGTMPTNPEGFEPIPLLPVNPTVWTTTMGFTPTTWGTMLVAFSDTFTTDPSDAIDATITPTLNALATAQGTPIWEFGYTGLNGTPVNEVFSIATNEINFDDLGVPTPQGVPDIVTFSAALNVTYSYDPSSLPLPVNVISGLPAAQIQLAGSVDAEETGIGDFLFATDANLYMNVVPEPGSVLALVSLVVAGLLLPLRRRR